VGAEVGGGATMKNGVATVGVEGEVALLVGVDVDLSVSVDTKPAQEFVEDTGNTVVNRVTEDANTVAKETTKVANTVAKETTKAANTVADGAKDVGKSIGKAFKKPKFKF
jgi:hypothetical protein